MPKIELRENKILKLSNVLQRKIPQKELMQQDKQISMMYNWIKAKGYNTMGPLIMYSKGVVEVDKDGTPMIDSYIMSQLKEDKIRLELPYKFENLIRRENCIMVRFVGSIEKLQFATNKITLYSYENDIELTGESYIILLEQKEKDIIADVFMPIK